MKNFLTIGVALVGIMFASVVYAGDCRIDLADIKSNDGTTSVEVTVNLCPAMLVPHQDGGYLGVRGVQRISIKPSEVNLDDAKVEYTYLTSPGTQIKFTRTGKNTYAAVFDPAEWDTAGQGAAVGNWQVRLSDGKTVIFVNLAAVSPIRNGKPCEGCVVAKPANFRQPGETEEVFAFTFRKPR